MTNSSAARPFDRSREGAAWIFGNSLYEHPAHAPGRSDNNETHLRHRDQNLLNALAQLSFESAKIVAHYVDPPVTRRLRKK
ncbi:hypothetical protein [Neorhizobium galegae]|uniref:hypothetical protein n=1 Tax=Neorhizobium galegae TaxID=399 RepID=UPI0021073D81|nr:hypothetical protein [Neorhizobium galegae]MCQ1797452.1 hypothetical protein [Neorhizobium galegae]